MVGDRRFADERERFDRWVLDQDWPALEAFLAARAAGRDDDAAAFFFRGYVHGVARRLGVSLPTTVASSRITDDGGMIAPSSVLHSRELGATMADIDAHPEAFASFARGFLAGLRGAEGAR